MGETCVVIISSSPPTTTTIRLKIRNPKIQFLEKSKKIGIQNELYFRI
jgi:hypothetical protein